MLPQSLIYEGWLTIYDFIFTIMQEQIKKRTKQIGLDGDSGMDYFRNGSHAVCVGDQSGRLGVRMFSSEW